MGKKGNYGDEEFDVLLGLEGIRKRYHMYLSSDPVNHCTHELFDNVLDEFTNGYATKMIVEINTKENCITVTDDGRGLPLGINKKVNKPTMEMILTMLHSGAKLGGDSYKTSAGQNGIGLKGLSACSKLLEVISYREGLKGTIKISKGKVIQPFKKFKSKDVNRHGCIFKFIPDDTLFRKDILYFDVDRIREDIKLRCYLNANFEAILIVNGKKEVFKYKYGLNDFLNTKVKSPLFNMENINIIHKDEDDNTYNIAFTYQNTTDEDISGFTNSIPNESGTHITGFKKGIAQAITNYIKENSMLQKKDAKLEIKGEDCRRGLVCIINILHNSPEYNSQSKSQLTNKEVDTEVKKAVMNYMEGWFRKNPKLAKALCERAISFSRATNNAKEAMKKITSVSNNNLGLKITPKFKDCDSNDNDKVEIFVIEGDSAAGTVENARNAEYQALFPLKGKPKNAYGVTYNSIMANEELNNFLMIEFGTNNLKNIKEILKECKEKGTSSKLKSKKIIILSDADEDGSHIVMLFIAFIYCHLYEMIELGYLYIALSPFYRVNKNGKFLYFMNDKEYNNFKNSIIKERYSIDESEMKFNKVLNLSEKFLLEFNRIMYKYAIDPDILSVIIHSETEKEMINELKENGLKYDSKINDCKGLFNNKWHDFNLLELVEECEDSLFDIYPFNYLTIKDKNTKEEYVCDIYDGLNILNSAYKYTRTRFKGLGESDAEELEPTTINPESRRIIKINLSKDKEKEEEMMKILFGSNADLRKEYIINNLFNK